MASNDEVNIFKEALNAGCCLRCALRFVGNQSLNFYDLDSSSICLGFFEPDDRFVPPLTKKPRLGPCAVCLGLLEDGFLEKILTHKDLLGASEYQFKTYEPNISFPTCVIIRNHSMVTYLQEKLSTIFKAENVIPVNKAWRYAVERKLSKVLRKTYTHASKFHVLVRTVYPFDRKETIVMQRFHAAPNSRKRGFSKQNVVEKLQIVSSVKFKRIVQVPPSPPEHSVELKEIVYQTDAFFIYGTYCKYTRFLNQQPLNVHKVCVMRHSVETIIYDAIEDAVGCGPLKYEFRAAGFEDREVRVLGDGRPFYFQINDPKFEEIPVEDFRMIEDEVRRSKIVCVKHLCEVERRELLPLVYHVKVRPKRYKVVCIIENSDKLQECIKKINGLSDTKVVQCTPLRHIHARGQEIKTKKVVQIEAKPVKGRENLIEMDVCADSGLYIMEFVNGDYGRTKPSLRSILGVGIDVLVMDVVNVGVHVLPLSDDVKELVE